MKANELQIGDYVNYRGQVIKVTSLYDKGGSNEVGWSDKESVWVNADNVEPIFLTAEILEKNGFCYCESDGGFYAYPDYNYNKCPLEVILFNVNSDIRNNQIHIEKIARTDECKECRKVMLHLMECNFVHQLQNIFIDLDINMEIVL